MRLDDETLLSAYLDGELDPDQRHRVEAALLSNALLADRLHDLAAVRDLFADLARPAPPIDLAPAVLARIEHPRPGDYVRIGPWRLTQAQWIARLCAAAMLVLAVTLGLLSAFKAAPPEPHRPVLTARGPRPEGPTRVAPAPSPRPTRAPRLAPPPITAQEVPVPTPALALRHDEAEDSQARIREALDNPNLRKIFIVTDRIGGNATARVDQLIQKTPRVEPTYGRITVSQGIVIDPRHPGEAIVFALAMDDHEFAQFRGELTKNFPQAVEETDADPGLVTQLANIGKVAIMQGTPSRDSLILPHSGLSSPRLATKADPGDGPLVRSSDDEQAAEPDAPRAEPPSIPPLLSVSRNVSALASRPEDARHGQDPGDHPFAANRANGRFSSIVLVWVTTRDPIGVGRRRTGQPSTE